MWRLPTEYLKFIISVIFLISIHGCGDFEWFPDPLQPSKFSFATQYNVATNTRITSEKVTLLGNQAAGKITISNGEYSVDGGDWTNLQGTLKAGGGTLQVRHTSSINAGASTTTTVDISGRSASFTSVTANTETNAMGLLTWYPFDGNASDTTGNGFNAIVYGASLATDRFGNTGKAYAFDGVNTYIDGGSRTLTLPITVSLWFKSSVVNGIYDTLFWWISPSEGFTGIQIMANNDGKMRTRIGSNGSELLSSKIIDGDNIWHMITVTRDLANNLTMYIDGQYETSKSITDSIGNSKQLLIGKSTVSGELFNGLIDDVRIYSKALTAAEVSTLFTTQ